MLLAVVAVVAACSKGKPAGGCDLHKAMREFVASHHEQMQANPDSIAAVVRAMSCGGDPDLARQWKRIVVAKCQYLKGDNAGCVAMADTVESYCRSHQGDEAAGQLLAYAYNVHGVALMADVQRDSGYAYSMRAYNEALRLADRSDIVDISIDVADAFFQQGKLADAASWYRRASVLADSLHMTDIQGFILTGLGQVYGNLQNYRLAHRYFAKAERLVTAGATPKDLHFFYNNWGNVYSGQGKPAEALRCFRKAQRAARDIDQPLLTALVDANLGQTFLELNRLDSAQKYLARASAFFLAKPDMQSDTQFYVDGLNAMLALEQGDLAKATAILGKPYDLSRMNPNYLYLHNKSLAQLYERKGQYAKALYCQKLTNSYSDSLRNAAVVSNVYDSELRFKQDTAIVHRDANLSAARAQARSARVISLLAWVLVGVGVVAFVAFYRYKSLRAANQRHQAKRRMMALKMENVRNRFSPHFVFNVLNAFMAGLPAGVSVRPLRLLIQVLRVNLLSCDKIAVSLDEELQMVMAYASLRHETNPSLPMPRLDVASGVDRALMLPSMIVQIPVENALKHAFVGMEADGGRQPSLDVRVWVDDATLRIDVVDNGCGGAAARPAGVKPHSAVSTGTGLRILNATIEMLNAGNARKMYFRMQSRQDTGADGRQASGTCVSIGVPCGYDFSAWQ